MEPSKNHPLVGAAVAGVLIFGILGVAVVKEVRQSAASRRDVPADRPNAVAVEAAFESVVRPRIAPGACGDCGVLQAVRLVKTDYSQRYLVTLRMDDGTLRTLSLAQAPAYAVGEQVRLLNGALPGRR